MASCTVSTFYSTKKDVASVQTLLDANKTLRLHKRDADVGVHFTPMATSLQDLCVLGFSDATWDLAQTATVREVSLLVSLSHRLLMESCQQTTQSHHPKLAQIGGSGCQCFCRLHRLDQDVSRGNPDLAPRDPSLDEVTIKSLFPFFHWSERSRMFVACRCSQCLLYKHLCTQVVWSRDV